MALNVKPTRMELSNLKKRLKVAVRGHKLMKDKRDEMVRRFISYARLNYKLRQEVEAKMSESMQSFVLARAMMSNAEIEEALAFPAMPASIKTSESHILNFPVPKLELVETENKGYPYGFATTSSDLDTAVREFSELLPLLIQLAEVEKICSRLADEIEKTRRRVNALEYVMIPQFEEAIKSITMKLEENERGNLTRIMKTKEMINDK